MVTFLVTAAAALFALVAELLHGRRVRAAAHLAFGPTRRPLAWVHAVPALRVAAHTLLAWGLVTLLQLAPKVHVADHVADEDWRHLVLVLDVSPSMMLRDAGPNGNQSRSERTRDLVESLFERVSIGKFKITVVATYNGAKPVVVDTKDTELVRHVLSAIDMRYAFKAGKTNLFDGIAEAAKIAKPWPAKSSLVVILSDGDTVPATGMPEMPPSVSGVLVVGVGDPYTGKFLAGHQSRQDTATLRQVATRLNGEFHDGNKKHVSSDTLAAVAADARKPLIERLTLREYALLAVTCAASFLALLPVLLHLAGTRWRPGVRAVPEPAVAEEEEALAPAGAAAR